RQDGRIAEGIAQHQCANLHTLCRFGQRRQHGPAFPNTPGRLTRRAIQEVVSEPDAIEAICFRLLRNSADRRIRTLAVVFSVVRKEDHQSNLHGVPQLSSEYDMPRSEGSCFAPLVVRLSSDLEGTFLRSAGRSPSLYPEKGTESFRIDRAFEASTGKRSIPFRHGFSAKDGHPYRRDRIKLGELLLCAYSAVAETLV